MSQDKFLQTGDVFELAPGMRVQAEIPEMFAYSNRPGSWERASSTIRVGDTLRAQGQELDTSKLVGRYVVVRTAFDGGGEGHGPGDVYPDGHHVFAQKLGEDGSFSASAPSVRFYQSGCFNCMVTPDQVQAVGRMEQTFLALPAISELASSKAEAAKPSKPRGPKA